MDALSELLGIKRAVRLLRERGAITSQMAYVDGGATRGGFGKKTQLKHNIEPAIVAKVNGLIGYDASKIAPNTAFAAVVVELTKHNLCYDVTPDPDEMAVHPENRGEAMVTRYGVHSKGERIKAAGVKEPIGGFAFELCPMTGDPIHDGPVAANKEMIARGNGGLAPWTNKERYLSVATSNCFQLSKAIRHGCPTDVDGLKDVNGRLSQANLESQDPGWTRFCRGWRISVFTWTCELAFPGLAYLAQLAQNTDNRVGNAMGEAESLVAILRGVKRGLTFDCATEGAKASCDCITALPSLRQVAEFFGPDRLGLFVRLDSFRSMIDSNVDLGAEFYSKVATSPFKPEGSASHVHVRLAEMAVNVISPTKDKHGFGNMFGGSDIMWFRDLGNRTEVARLDKDIANILEWCCAMEKQGALRENESNLVSFRFATRAALFLRNKLGASFEFQGRDVAYKTMADIRSAAAAEIIAKVAKGKVNTCEWTATVVTAKAKAKAATVSAIACVDAVADGQIHTVTGVLALKRLVVGATVEDTRCKGLRSLYTITQINDGKRIITLDRLTYDGMFGKFTAALTVEEMLKWFRLVNAASVPTFLNTDVLTRSVKSSSAVSECSARLAVYHALLAADDNSDPLVPAFRLLVHGRDRRLLSNHDFKPNELVLLPRTFLSLVTRPDKRTDKVVSKTWMATVEVDGVSIVFQLKGPATPMTDDESKLEAGAVFEPFWWVSESSNANEVNMVAKEMQVGGVVFPYLTNTGTVTKLAELKRAGVSKEVFESLETQSRKASARTIVAKAVSGARGVAGTMGRRVAQPTVIAQPPLPTAVIPSEGSRGVKRAPSVKKARTSK